MNQVFILGSEDPEMDHIEEILLFNNLSYGYATKNGKRCHPGNSYHADNDLSKYDQIIFIEANTTVSYKNTISFDHHHEGDYGYHLNHEDFLTASSIGQLISYLIKNKLCQTDNFVHSTSNVQNFMFIDNQWVFLFDNKKFFIPQKYVISAAYDHSLCAVYQDLCKGICVQSVFSSRLLDFSNRFDLHLDVIYNLISEYSIHFQKNKREIRDLSFIDVGIGYSLDYLLLRELAFYNNQPIVLKTKNTHSDNDKLMFLSLSVKEASELLETKIFNNTPLNSIFGVPNRGYVGAFI